MTILKNLFVILAAALSGVYLLNLGFGVVELVPDILPGIGSLDEATATLILINCLAYFGFDARRLLNRDAQRPIKQVPNTQTSR